MTVQEVRKAHQLQPFRPFTLHLADGREIHIPEAAYLYIPPKIERTVVATTLDGEFEIIDVLMVTTIRFGSLGRGNGRGRSSRSSK